MNSVVRLFRQKYRYVTVQHNHAILHFFFVYTCNLNLSRCRAVLMYDIVFFLSVSALNTWSQKQHSSLIYLVSEGLWDIGKGWERVYWEGKGGVSCGIITIFIYNIYSIYIFTILHGGRFARCRFVALYLVVFIMIYYVFSVLVFCVFLGEDHVVSPPSVCSPSI